MSPLIFNYILVNWLYWVSLIYQPLVSSAVDKNENFDNESQHNIERGVLDALYEAFGGDTWYDSDGCIGDDIDIVGKDHCNWCGVNCDDETNLITKLFLQEENLKGSIPTDIGILKSLKLLSFYDNFALTGNIPTEIGNLERLEDVEMSWTKLSGTIPDEIISCKELRVLELGYTQLTGSITSDIEDLKHLRHLSLTNTTIIGTIPSEVGKLQELAELYLSRTNIEGTIPSEVGNMWALRILDISDNAINGRIPTEIVNLEWLKTLNISRNVISGTIQSEIGNLTLLERLDLSRTNIEGTIPSEVGNLIELQELDISENDINGTIPTEVGNLINLKTLHASRNNISGTIPSELGHNKNLVSLKVDRNNLEGGIPSSLLDSLSLQYLHLNNNRINETLDNIFNITVPNFPDLVDIVLSNNIIRGSIPKPEKLDINTIKRVDLENNCITGELPDNLHFLFPKILILNLSKNKDTSNIKCCVQINENFVKINGDVIGGVTCENLTGLKGRIPKDLDNLLDLKKLDLSDNNLFGTVPIGVGNIQELEELILSNNELTGKLPSQLGRLSSSTAIKLSFNKFEEPAPLSLCALSKLRDRLQDPGLCPPERTSLKYFYEFAKGNNWINNANWSEEYSNQCSWYGVTCKGGNVSSIDLQNNGLSGFLSSDIGSFPSLEKLNLTDNSMKGSIPSDINKLASLKELLLSYNDFIGSVIHIPMELDSLELQSNRLTGSVTFGVSNKDDSYFVSDCGSPSWFKNVLICHECTQCCNLLNECEDTDQAESKWASTYGLLIVSFATIGICFITACVSWAVKHNSVVNPRTLQKIEDKINLTGQDSVYSFFQDESYPGWIFALFVCSIQLVILNMFTKAARLELDDETSDWRYKGKCLPDGEDCDFEEEDMLVGWFIFSILMSIEVLFDLMKGFYLIVHVPGMVHFSFLKQIRYLFSGTIICLVIVAFSYVSIVYNIAIARKPTELIVNAVIFSFIITIDEQFYSVYQYFCNYWVVELEQASFRHAESSFKYTTGTVNDLKERNVEEFKEEVLAESEMDLSCEKKVGKEMKQLKEKTEELEKDLKEMKSILLDMITNQVTKKS